MAFYPLRKDGGEGGRTLKATQPYLEEHLRDVLDVSEGVGTGGCARAGPSDGTVFTVALGRPC